MKGSRVWVILHQPLYHTYIHHDASGTGTWMSIASGNKFWIFAIPKNDAQCTSLDALHTRNSQYMLSEDDHGKWLYAYPQESERFCIFGKCGDMMCVNILFFSLFVCEIFAHRFQPPNAWHEVYTPSKSVTVGGHYYTYDTLHLSDAVRHFDIIKPGMTNQHHTSSQLTMSSMLVYMISLGPRRKSYISLNVILYINKFF